MKKFISVNAKYYKTSKASGAMGHVDRLFKTNINTFSKFTKHNFSRHSNSYEQFQKIHKRREVVGYKARNDANTFIDAVVSFSLEQWEVLEKKHGHKNLQRAMKLLMEDFTAEMEKKYGLFSYNYSFHLDEGNVKNRLIRNVHAHVLFYNYDFKTKTSPLRKLTKKDFSNWQSILANSFKKSGYIRGISKEKTKRKHLSKDDFIARKHKLLNEDIEVKQRILDSINDAIKLKITELGFGLVDWIKRVLSNESAEIESKLAKQKLDNIEQDELKDHLQQIIENIEDEHHVNTKDRILKNNKNRKR